MRAGLEQTDKRIDEMIGWLLRGGVSLAAMVVLLGGIVYLARHPGPVPDYRNFQGEPPEYRSISGIVRAALAFRGRGLIQLGVLLLIATPVARVVFSIFAFVYERDWKYVVFTLIVLGILVFSLMGGHF
jgi:uncharacterized membrane protein